MYQPILDRLLAAWNQGEMDGLDAVVAPNFVRRGPATIDSDANGLEELKARIQQFRTSFPDCHVQLNEVHFLGNRCFARWTFTGTNTGPGECPITGKSVAVQGTTFATFADNQIVEEHVLFDVFGFMMQLGLLEQPEATH